jgi:hypothetical protein
VTDRLVQTRVPEKVARWVTNRAKASGDTVASWLRRLLIKEAQTDTTDTSAKGGAPPAHVAHAGRVKVEERPGMPQFGVCLGLYLDEHGDVLAIVRLDRYGLYLKALHPSKVTPITPEQEEAYKP